MWPTPGGSPRRADMAPVLAGRCSRVCRADRPTRRWQQLWFQIAVGAQISPVMCGAHRRPRCGQPPPEGAGTPVSPMPPVAVAAALAFSPEFWPDAGGFWPHVRVLGAAGEAGLGDEPELAGAGDGLGA